MRFMPQQGRAVARESFLSSDLLASAKRYVYPEARDSRSESSSHFSPDANARHTCGSAFVPYFFFNRSPRLLFSFSMRSRQCWAMNLISTSCHIQLDRRMSCLSKSYWKRLLVLRRLRGVWMPIVDTSLRNCWYAGKSLAGGCRREAKTCSIGSSRYVCAPSGVNPGAETTTLAPIVPSFTSSTLAVTSSCTCTLDTGHST